MASTTEITRLLHDAREGDDEAFDRVWPLVYDEMKRIAQAQLRREWTGHTLYATGLVHEAYLKLSRDRQAAWHSREQFFAIAARAMRQILVDRARKRDAQKRGGDWQRTPLTAEHLGVDMHLTELLALDLALDRLHAADERLHKVVELKFFGGMTEQEVADTLGVSKRTVQRDWATARDRLYRELYPDGS